MFFTAAHEVLKEKWHGEWSVHDSVLDYPAEACLPVTGGRW
jgi:hypothetical protein